MQSMHVNNIDAGQTEQFEQHAEAERRHPQAAARTETGKEVGAKATHAVAVARLRFRCAPRG